MPFRFLLLVTLFLTSSVLTTAHADIIWETDYNTARSKSMATGKPLFIDIYTDWCGWCKRLDSDVYPDPRVQQMSASFVMLKLNAEGTGAAFARSMQVTGYPTLIFATAQGGQLSRRGYMEPNDFVAVMVDSLRRNGPIRPARTATSIRTTRTHTTPAHMNAAPKARNWKAEPELHSVVRRAGYGGTFVLGDGGVVALDSPSTKHKKNGQMGKTSSKVRR
ncbi:thiol:disulfide interchange protein DsbD [Abditibacteriota bacterium]|nr:thiol:disulfide interchange protein DsbD [Abditibacteriota bacterium]